MSTPHQANRCHDDMQVCPSFDVKRNNSNKSSEQSWLKYGSKEQDQKLEWTVHTCIDIYKEEPCDNHSICSPGFCG